MSFRRRRWSIFDIFDEMMRAIEEEFAAIEEELSRMLREGRGEVRGPYVYGFRITIGPDGRPVVEEFGNIRRERGRPRVTEEREPLVDVFEDDKQVIVVAELPGVEKEKIKLRVVDGKKLVIRASDDQRKYYKEVELPAEVKPETAKASYRNGVLEVKLEKVEPRKEEGGVEIKVE